MVHTDTGQTSSTLMIENEPQDRPMTETVVHIAFHNYTAPFYDAIVNI